MTLSTDVFPVQQTGDGTNASITISDEFYSSSDLLVTSRVIATGVETVLVLGTHYNVEGGDTGSGPATGSVEVIDGATDFLSTVTWTITRFDSYEQDIDPEANQATALAQTAKGLNQLAAQVQRLREQVEDRSLHFPVSDPRASVTSSEIADSITRASTLLGFDSDGMASVTALSGVQAAVRNETYTSENDTRSISFGFNPALVICIGGSSLADTWAWGACASVDAGDSYNIARINTTGIANEDTTAATPLRIKTSGGTVLLLTVDSFGSDGITVTSSNSSVTSHVMFIGIG